MNSSWSDMLYTDSLMLQVGKLTLKLKKYIIKLLQKLFL